MRDDEPELAAVVFDLDDTLTDRRATLHAYARKLLRDYAAEHVRADPTWIAEIVRIDREGYNPQRADELAALDAWRGRPSAAELAAHWGAHFPGCSAPRAELLPTLHALRARGLRLGLVTNGGAVPQQAKIDALGVRELFGAILISESFGCAKPDARIFHAAAAELGVRPAQCLFVGDHPENDVAGAESAGMRAVWLAAKLAWPAGVSLPKLTVNSLTEVIDLLGLCSP